MKLIFDLKETPFGLQANSSLIFFSFDLIFFVQFILLLFIEAKSLFLLGFISVAHLRAIKRVRVIPFF